MLLISTSTRPSRLRRHAAGLTLIEMIMTVAIILILTAVAIPVIEVGIIRSKEIELRHSLRDIRNAIDMYHLYAKNQMISPLELETDDMFYPSDLTVLVEGVKAMQGPDLRFKFLRRLPGDPMMHEEEDPVEEWGKRSFQDDPESDLWGQENVFDIFTQYEGTALDGTEYREW